MQKSCTIGILIDSLQDKSCFQLSSDLFLNRMGKLKTIIMLDTVLILFLILQRIKWKRIMNGLFIVSGKQIIETIVKTCQQNAAFFSEHGNIPSKLV